MDDLIKQIQEKTGLASDKARDVIDTVVDFIADKLPGTIGDQVKGLLNGEDDGDNGGGDLMDQAKDALGGLLGGND